MPSMTFHRSIFMTSRIARFLRGAIRCRRRLYAGAAERSSVLSTWGPAPGGARDRLEPAPTCYMPLVMIAALALSTSCTQKMAEQPRYDPLAKSDFFANGMAARPLPVGVISRDYVPQDEPLDTGFLNGKPAEDFPFPVTREVLERGQQRYNIYCAPCHDYVGTGDGMAARRGLRSHPANFHTDGLLSSPPGH